MVEFQATSQQSQQAPNLLAALISMSQSQAAQSSAMLAQMSDQFQRKEALEASQASQTIRDAISQAHLEMRQDAAAEDLRRYEAKLKADAAGAREARAELQYERGRHAMQDQLARDRHELAQETHEQDVLEYNRRQQAELAKSQQEAANIKAQGDLGQKVHHLIKSDSRILVGADPEMGAVLDVDGAVSDGKITALGRRRLGDYLVSQKGFTAGESLDTVIDSLMEPKEYSYISSKDMGAVHSAWLGAGGDVASLGRFMDEVYPGVEVGMASVDERWRKDALGMGHRFQPASRTQVETFETTRAQDLVGTAGTVNVGTWSGKGLFDNLQETEVDALLEAGASGAYAKWLGGDQAATEGLWGRSGGPYIDFSSGQARWVMPSRASAYAQRNFNTFMKEGGGPALLAADQRQLGLAQLGELSASTAQTPSEVRDRVNNPPANNPPADAPPADAPPADAPPATGQDKRNGPAGTGSTVQTLINSGQLRALLPGGGK